MVITKYRRAGSLLLLLGTLGWSAGCVSGGDPGGNDNGPECYSNSDCSGGRECSSGICLGFKGCSSGSDCRNNEDCLDSVCRLKCESSSECTDQGLVCGNDTQHCKPGQNPTRPQSQPQSGSGGTTSSGTGGSGSTASTTGSAGKPAGTGGSAGAPTSGSSGTPGVGGAPTGAAGLGQGPTAGAHG